MDPNLFGAILGATECDYFLVSRAGNCIWSHIQEDSILPKKFQDSFGKNHSELFESAESNAQNQENEKLLSNGKEVRKILHLRGAMNKRIALFQTKRRIKFNSKWHILVMYEDCEQEILHQEEFQVLKNSYQQVFNSSVFAIIIYDSSSDNKMVDCNEEAVRLFGYKKRDQLLATRMADRLSLDQGEGRTKYDLIGEMVKALRSNKSGRFQCIAEKKNKTTFNVDLSVAQIQGSSQYVFYIQNVTERVLLDQQKQEKEQRFRDIFNASQIGWHMLDMSKVYADLVPLKKRKLKDYRRYLNKHPELIEKYKRSQKSIKRNAEFLRILGSQSGTEDELHELIAEGKEIKIYNRDESIKLELISFLEGKPFFEFESVIRDLNGFDRHVYFAGTYPLDGDFSQMLYCILDISPTKTAELALREQEEQYRNIFEISTVGIQTVDLSGMVDIIKDFKNQKDKTPEQYIAENWEKEISLSLRETGEVRTVNQALIDMTEAEPKDNFSKALFDISTNASEIMNQELCAILRGDKEFQAELEIVTFKGNLRTIFYSAQYPSQDFSNVVYSYMDITNQVKAQRDIRRKNIELQKYIESNVLLENFAYIASHDLKQPIRSISNFSHLLQRKLKQELDGEANDYLEYIIGGAKHMNNLIEDLLLYSRVNQDFKTEDLDLNELLEEILLHSSPLIRESNAEIIIRDIPKKLNASRVGITQVFQNLIANGIKFRKENTRPKIEVFATGQNNAVQFHVQDNGIGISAKNVHLLFQLFKKLHNRTEYPGTGLGLAICKKVIEKHGGSIWVDSTFGKGTTISFSLPQVGLFNPSAAANVQAIPHLS